MNSVYLIGEQRSGSNLLRMMLNQSNQLACPHPPHVLHRFFPLLGYYGDLTNDKAFLRLANDILELVKANPVEWERFSIDAEQLAIEARDRTLMALFVALMGAFARSQNGPRSWVCKSMHNVRFIEEIERHSKTSKFVYLYRDPRDVCLSFKNAVIGPKHVYCSALRWTNLQKMCLEVKNRLGKRCYLLSYEALITNPEVEMEKLSSFLNIETPPDCLEFYKSRESWRTAKSSSLWKNVVKPIKRNNLQKYQDQLSLEEVLLIEKVASKIMVRLGYDLENHPTEIELFEIHSKMVSEFQKKDHFMRMQTLLNMNFADRQRRMKQENLMASIVQRNLLSVA